MTSPYVIEVQSLLIGNSFFPAAYCWMFEIEPRRHVPDARERAVAAVAGIAIAPNQGGQRPSPGATKWLARRGATAR